MGVTGRVKLPTIIFVFQGHSVNSVLFQGQVVNSLPHNVLQNTSYVL